MDEHHSRYNGSVWHIHWPYQVYIGQWPIFYGPAILLHILKTIWWRNVALGIMDHCDLKINLVKYSAGEEKSPLFIFLHDQLPFFLGETGRNSGKFLQVSPGNPIFSPGNTCISPWNFRILPIKLHVFSEKLCYFSLKFLWEISCFSLKF